ncbi:hypothetical protein ACQB60_10425 [Actinomycetota bacterium Odt1-20B]
MTAIRKLCTALLVLAGAASGLSVTTAPAAASASAQHGCAWPNVCFYKTDADWRRQSPTATYKDMTPKFQPLGSRSRGSDWIHNSRNDDRALVRYTFGGSKGQLCLEPHQNVSLSDHTTVTSIKIEDSARC